jgi:hypothetical protein
VGRFEQIWAGDPEPRLRALPRTTPGPVPPSEAGPLAERFAAYVRARLEAVPADPSRLDLDRVKVRLCDRLSKELRIAGASPERGALLEILADALDEVKERELEVEPANLVERIIVREPAPQPLTAQQAMGIFYNDSE